jgi:hypothetical protein
LSKFVPSAVAFGREYELAGGATEYGWTAYGATEYGWTAYGATEYGWTAYGATE